VAEGKPDPACYLLAAARLGVDPRTCLVVEDSAPGVAAGRAAGAKVAALGAVQADVQIPDLHALVDLLGA
jgi:mannitol-1-/sugar-/sorbitol-6-phosphatase